MSRTIYLKSYDRYAEVLVYTLPEGKFTILQSDQVEASGIPLTFGAFCSEGPQVAGIFATPQGPVLFLDAKQVLGVHGQTFATVQDVPGESRKYFYFGNKQPDGQAIGYGLHYKKRLGIGANPYDNEEEDIDLLALIATNIGHAAFFRAYTKDWVG